MGELAATGDFRRGSISENYRRCGKPNCACAQPDHPGHGPRYLWTRTVAGRGTKGRQLSAGEVDKVRGELANYQRFAEVTRGDRGGQRGDLRGAPAQPGALRRPRPRRGPKKGALRPARGGVRGGGEPAGRAGVRSLGSTGAGMEAVELAIRTAMTSSAP